MTEAPALTETQTLSVRLCSCRRPLWFRAPPYQQPSVSLRLYTPLLQQQTTRTQRGTDASCPLCSTNTWKLECERNPRVRIAAENRDDSLPGLV